MGRIGPTPGQSPSAASPRRLTVTAELREDGERVNHKRIARVTRGIGLAGVRAVALRPARSGRRRSSPPWR